MRRHYCLRTYILVNTLHSMTNTVTILAMLVIFAGATLSITGFSVQVLFPSVLATSPTTPLTESDYNEAISLLITDANLTIDEAIQAVQDNNSTETLLAFIRITF